MLLMLIDFSIFYSKFFDQIWYVLLLRISSNFFSYVLPAARFLPFSLPSRIQIYTFYHYPFTNYIHSSLQETWRRRCTINKLSLYPQTVFKLLQKHCTTWHQIVLCLNYFFQLNWDLNFGDALKPHSRDSSNGIWRNSYDLWLLMQQIKLCKFQGKGRQITLLGSSYKKRKMTDNFQHRNSIYFDIFWEQKISESCSTYFRMA